MEEGEEMKWCQDLMDYYGVTESQAIDLGTRRTGRRPNLPSSETCDAVSGKNFEELWDLNPRETIKQKMDFYKDIGAWQVFRQCVYRNGFNYSKLFYPYLKDDSSILEYGCGVAPFTNYVVNDRNVDNMKFNLVDVSGEHLNFAKWRLNRKNLKASIRFHEITPENLVPKFDDQFDIVCIMDTFEHLPNPYDVLVNIEKHCNPNAVLVETWVDKSHGKAHGPDLEEAEYERGKTMGFLRDKFTTIKKGTIRVHRKKV
jgi:2-polyprenyl-3-methyl-5-hydroxy-6-metoxy-1,4-benzoquinol methylase